VLGGAKLKEHAMRTSQKTWKPISTIGIDVGKNTWRGLIVTNTVHARRFIVVTGSIAKGRHDAVARFPYGRGRRQF